MMNILTAIKNKLKEQFRGQHIQDARRKRIRQALRLSSIQEDLQVAKAQAKVRQIGYSYLHGGNGREKPHIQ